MRHPPQISYQVPPNDFSSGHALSSFREESPESDNASPCQALHHTPSRNNQFSSSNQSYCVHLIVLPRARRASLFPTSSHSNLAGFSQSLDNSWIAFKKLLLPFRSISLTTPGPTSLMFLHPALGELQFKWQLYDSLAVTLCPLFLYFAGWKGRNDKFLWGCCLHVAEEINWAGRLQCKLNSLYCSYLIASSCERVKTLSSRLSGCLCWLCHRCKRWKKANGAIIKSFGASFTLYRASVGIKFSLASRDLSRAICYIFF